LQCALELGGTVSELPLAGRLTRLRVALSRTGGLVRGDTDRLSCSFDELPSPTSLNASAGIARRCPAS
jgi:hypothetical protein